MDSQTDGADETSGIAIIGMAGRFPGASNVGEYWANLAGGVESITFDVQDARGRGANFVNAAPLLADFDRFDAGLFDCSPREAALLDPQHRVFLECAWQALEDAGYDPLNVAARCGVYGGSGGLTQSYGFAHAHRLAAENTATGGLAHLSNDKDYLATRVSYKLNLRGPSLTIQTACSTSLVAVHVACQSILSGECDLALAGGVTIRVPQRTGYLHEEGGIASPDGHCRAFDARAQGTIFGSGAGVVVLKRLVDALADGDRVLAVIKGSAVNNDGGAKLSYTAASETGQAEAVAEALAVARIDPRSVGYVEAHGTGTALGDPVEVAALSKVFRGSSRETRFCAIGSVKTNIGHLEAAAGIAGLIKTVLALVHRQIPASLHFEQPNPRIDFERGPFFVNTLLRAWERGPAPRRAGVNSLGIGGTNAFVVLEEAPAAMPLTLQGESPARGTELLCLSAKNEQALTAVAQGYLEALERGEAPAADLCYTTQVARAQLPERLVVAGESAEALRGKLAGFLARKRERGVFRGRALAAPKIAFLFTGQGSQYPGMARRLFESEPVFRRMLERCEAAVRPELPTSLFDAMYPAQGAATPLDETLYAQAALFAVQLGLVELWKSWGIEPAVVMGHSAGEYAAAAVAGIFSIEDALLLIARRGHLVRQITEPGSMAAVFADEVRVRQTMGARAAISAVNGPENVAISGDRQTVAEAVALLDRQGIRSWPLPVTTPFHSPLMEPWVAPFEEIAQAARYGRPRLPFISNLSGEVVADDFASNARYWARHMHEPVQFEAGMRSLERLDARLFVEIGPNPTLLNLGKRCLPDPERAWLMSLRNGRDDQQQMIESLGELWAWGAKPAWKKFHAGQGRSKVAAPGYPFQRERYWLEDAGEVAPRTEAAQAPLPGRRISSPLAERQFEARISPALVPLVQEHRIYGEILLPGAFHLAMALAGAKQSRTSGPIELAQVLFPQALVLSPEETCSLQLIFRPNGDDESFSVHSQSLAAGDLPWRLHAQGRVATGGGRAPRLIDDERAALMARLGEHVLRDDFYREMAANHIDLGPGFRWHADVWRDGRELLTRIERAADPLDDLPLHPGLIDSSFQTVIAGLTETYVPFEIDRVRFWPQPGPAAWCRATLRPESGTGNHEILSADVWLYDAAGEAIFAAEGLHLKRARPGALLRESRDPNRWTYEVAWREAAPVKPPTSQSPGNWLLLADRGGVAESLARELEARGDRAILLGASPEFAGQAWSGIVHCGSLDVNDDPDTLPASADSACHSVLAVARQLELAPGASLHLVTRGAQPAGDSSSTVVGLSQAPLIGLARVIAREFPRVRVQAIDLDPARPATEAADLARELAAEDHEAEVALRSGRRLVPRLRALRASRIAEDDPRDQQLSIQERGTLDNLQLREAHRRKPGPGEVEIRTAAAGLNFRDVLGALGSYPGDPGQPGLECAGTITAIGPDVEHLAVGDEVLAIAFGCFRRFVVTPGSLVVRRPATLDPATGASLPVAFLTAQLALEQTARLSAGQRVLIHAAAGGVGLAAVQIALRRGATVIGSAGSPAKRDYLQSLGVEWVVDSRSLDFATEIRRQYGEQPLDVVLNSLSGEAIAESLSLLRPGGVFVEIGKVGVWDEPRMALERPDVRYRRIALDTMFVEEPEFFGSMLRSLAAEFEDGRLSPIPVRTFPLEDGPQAFRFMAQAKHMGKVVLTTQTSAPAEIRSDRTYLIIGGLGFIGLTMARWLVGRGARNLILAGRRSPDADARRTLAEFAAAGVEVEIARLDVADRAAVERLVAAVPATAPLAGVFHAAGVLDDGLLIGQTPERFDRVLAPKVAGAWNLHRATESLPLDHFVMCSSLASLLGSPGQGSYAAANAFLDALASWRRSRGLAALTINWGPWSGGGMAARLGTAGERAFEAAGIERILPEQGAEFFQRAMAEGRSQLAVLPIDWRRYQQQFGDAAPPAMLEEVLPRGSHASRSEATPVAKATSPTDNLAAILRSASGDELHPILEREITRHASRVLGLKARDVLDPAQPLIDYGLDSLLAVELANILSRSLGVPVPTSLVFDHPSVSSLAEHLAGLAAASVSCATR